MVNPKKVGDKKGHQIRRRGASRREQPPQPPPQQQRDDDEDGDGDDASVAGEPAETGEEVVVPAEEAGNKRQRQAPVRLSDEQEERMVEFLKLPENECIWSSHIKYRDTRTAEKVAKFEKIAGEMGKSSEF